MKSRSMRFTTRRKWKLMLRLKSASRMPVPGVKKQADDITPIRELLKGGKQGREGRGEGRSVQNRLAGWVARRFADLPTYLKSALITTLVVNSDPITTA
jgi:hypothetical protein